MKTQVLLVAILLTPFYLFSQGAGQKQSFSQTGSTGGQTRVVQETPHNNTTYQPSQTYQPTLQVYQTQPQPQTNQTVQRENTQFQQGHQNYSSIQNQGHQNYVKKSGQVSPIRQSPLGALNRMDIYTGKRTGMMYERSSPELSSVKKEVVLDNIFTLSPRTDSSASHYTGGIVIVNNSGMKPCMPKSPEVVYKLTRTLRLCRVIGNFCGWRDLNGYGVHVATFANFDYCVGVANWLKRKYHATTYIFEDQSGSFRYHLIFGKWTFYKEAEAFEEKISRDAPYAFVCMWRSDFSVLLPNGKIMPGY